MSIFQLDARQMRPRHTSLSRMPSFRHQLIKYGPMWATSLTSRGKVRKYYLLFDATSEETDLTVTSTTGIDNKPGATRTFSYGFPVVETLLQYVDTPQVKYYEYGFSLENSAPATVEGILFTDLVNLMKTTNITAGADAGKTSFECE